ncbi:hypothetical protein M434DRAFT_397170 [Hypoxylon sp. CO27-5]|nr:hypothetical protein M434DRAFT_397170 [Hypoxylon sp. CO27-5]
MSDPLESPELPGNELSFFLQTRYLCVIEWLHRPFLYCLLHAQPSPARALNLPPLVPLAQRNIDISCALIRLVAVHHRHGGIWGLTRRSFVCSLLLIAAARYNVRDRDLGTQVALSSEQRIHLPSDWHKFVRMSINTIQRWETCGAKDLQWMGRILQGLVEMIDL